MALTRERTRLEQAGQVAFIVMCLSVAGAGVRYAVGAPRDTPIPPTRPPAITVGSLLPSTDLLNPRRARAALILALSTECRFCTESIPFYRELAELDQAEQGRIQVSIASFQDHARMREYLRGHGVSTSIIMEMRRSSLRVAATPTVILVDSEGKVVKVWEGRLERDVEQEVIRATTQLARS